MNISKLDISWTEPKPRPIGGHAEIAQQLRKNPGQWARIERPYGHASGRSVSYRINGGGLGYVPAGDYEATHRMEDGATYVYVRYLGDGVADE
ncbi:hypothetical protein [Streptomyces roseolus]|uniref:hypothetical protein n=1 Tax=Streptomyces roseolus TaxID=67358 RepID=UPI0036607FA0